MLLVLGLIALVLFGVPWGLVALLAALCLEVLEYFFWQRFLRRYRLRSGPETMVGQRASVIDECAPLGKVRFQGEVWNARASDPVSEGETVLIKAVHGLELEVERESRL